MTRRAVWLAAAAWCAACWYAAASAICAVLDAVTPPHPLDVEEDQ